jgi:hypothetical protein
MSLREIADLHQITNFDIASDRRSSWPSTVLMTVDLPTPLGPMSAAISPRSNLMLSACQQRLICVVAHSQRFVWSHVLIPTMR